MSRNAGLWRTLGRRELPFFRAKKKCSASGTPCQCQWQWQFRHTQWFFVELDPACFRRRVVLHVEYSFTMSSSSSSYSRPKFGGRGEEGTRGLLLQGPGAPSPLRLVVPLSTELQVTFTTATQCCYCFRALS